MRTTGLDMLQVQDSAGRILSSGHFRNEFDRLEPALPRALGAAKSAVLVPVRAPEGPFLALARVDSVSIADRRFSLVGGVKVDSAFLQRFAREEGQSVILSKPVIPSEARDRDHPDREIRPSTGTTAIPRLTARDDEVIAELPLPYLADSLTIARLIISMHPRARTAPTRRRSVVRCCARRRCSRCPRPCRVAIASTERAARNADSRSVHHRPRGTRARPRRGSRRRDRHTRPPTRLHVHPAPRERGTPSTRRASRDRRRHRTPGQSRHQERAHPHSQRASPPRADAGAGAQTPPDACSPNGAPRSSRAWSISTRWRATTRG